MNVDAEYQGLLYDIVNYGIDSDDRTGVGTKSLFGKQMEACLQDNRLPVISVRRVAPRIAFEELMFMLNGKTQTKELEAKKVFIWKDNTSREFLDARGLAYLDEGDFGRMYGSQLRDFSGFGQHLEDVGFDQLKYMVNEIKTNPTSRRIISTHYNPAEGSQGALFPCHIMTQFNVNNGVLDCLFWMRSSDVCFGLPYNLMYYGMFTHMMAKLCGLTAGRVVYQAGDAHLYKNQLDCGMVDYMIKDIDEVFTTPKFIINKPLHTLEDMLSLQYEDVEIVDYNPRPDFKNKPKMAV